MSKKLDRAKELLNLVRNSGSNVSIQGNWIKYDPPPKDPSILIDISKHANEIKFLIESEASQ